MSTAKSPSYAPSGDQTTFKGHSGNIEVTILVEQVPADKFPTKDGYGVKIVQHGKFKIPFVMKQLFDVPSGKFSRSVVIGAQYKAGDDAWKTAATDAARRLTIDAPSPRARLWNLLHRLKLNPRPYNNTRIAKPKGAMGVGVVYHCGTDETVKSCDQSCGGGDSCATCMHDCCASAENLVVGASCDADCETCECGCVCACHSAISDGTCFCDDSVGMVPNDGQPPASSSPSGGNTIYERDPQRRTLDVLMAGKNVIPVMPTFSGQRTDAPLCSFCGALVSSDPSKVVPCECGAAIYCSADHRDKHMNAGHRQAHDSTLALKKISDENAKLWKEGTKYSGTMMTPASVPPVDSASKLFTREQATALGMTKIERTAEDVREEEAVRKEYEARYGSMQSVPSFPQPPPSSSSALVGMPELIDIDTGEIVRDEDSCGAPRGGGGGGRSGGGISFGGGRSGGGFGMSGGGGSRVFSGGRSPAWGSGPISGPKFGGASGFSRYPMVPGRMTMPTKFGVPRTTMPGVVRSPTTIPGLTGPRPIVPGLTGPIRPVTPGYRMPWGGTPMSPIRPGVMPRPGGGFGYPGWLGRGSGYYTRPWYRPMPYWRYRYPWMAPMGTGLGFLLGAGLGAYASGYPYYYGNYYSPYVASGVYSVPTYSYASVPYGYSYLFEQLPAPPLYDVGGGQQWAQWWQALMILAAQMGMVAPAFGTDWNNVVWKTPNYGIHPFYWIPPSFMPYIEQSWAMQRQPIQ